MSEYYVLLCHCGRWSSKEIRTSLFKAKFKCIYCQKTTKLLKEKRKIPGLDVLHFGPYKLGREAGDKVRELSANQWRKDNGKTY